MVVLAAAARLLGRDRGCPPSFNMWRQYLPKRPFFSSLKGSTSPLLRFAPSPTGQLHLGGLRTALFNHLYAKKFGGRWILRIEDTDQKRYVPGSFEAMQNILSWSGLEYDEGPGKPGEVGPYIQSERLQFYSSHAKRLLDSQYAYRDFESEGDHRRNIEEQAGPLPLDKEQELLNSGKSYVIRLRMPKHTVQVQDLVYGKLTFPFDEAIGDPILMKSDGWPTYHLANVVDDHSMGITHVLRGEEWLPSMPIHVRLYDAFRFKAPSFAHLPLLVNIDGSKLSKRHADVHVESYRSQGFEPEALVNFVALMGYNWHATEQEKQSEENYDTSEVFTMQDMVDKFDPTRISHSRATPDMKKLLFLNKQHLLLKIREGTANQQEDLVSRLTTLIQERWPDEEITGWLGTERVLGMAQLFVGRADTLQGMLAELDHLFEVPDWKSEEAQEMLATIGPEEYERVVWRAHDFISEMHGRDVERLPRLEAALKDLASIVIREQKAKGDGQKKGRGNAALLKPLRLALTAKKSGPTVAETISLLGPGPTLQRLEAAMQYLAESLPLV